MKDQVMTTPDDTDHELEEATAAKKPRLWMILAAVAGLILVITAIGAVTRNAHTTPTTDDVRNGAKRACQEQFIPDRLKSPATAKYSGVTVSMTGTKSYGDEYTVTGSVDAENAFSALVRSTFTCVVHPSGDQWALVSATIG